MSAHPEFADRLLAWWRDHGRHDLPWQHPCTPYRVWVSEIMLQQTRAATVAPYFRAFMERFPALPDLAAAPLDAVLACWSGLGYYARARNLHAAAGRCMSEHGGELPADPEALESLPGIGRSTASAILAQAFDRPAVILDGNVKRVIARHAGIEGWPGAREVERALLAAADARTPPDRARDYAQAIMDLGATLCTPRGPDCVACPVRADCSARRTGRTSELPAPRPRKALPERCARFFIIEDTGGRVLLVRRPPAGIWGGLWCLPQDEAPVRLAGASRCPIPAERVHGFTHFRLKMRFSRHRPAGAVETLAEDGLAWFEPKNLAEVGLPQPIRAVLEELLGPAEIVNEGGGKS